MNYYFYSMGYMLRDHWDAMMWMVSHETYQAVSDGLANEENQ